MYKVRKKFRVPIGHRLSKHSGLCKNIHGHNIVVEVQLRSKHLDKNDMVIDFYELKNIVGTILSEFDHALILNCKEAKNLVDFQQQKVKFLMDDYNTDPTAEVMSWYLFYRVNKLLKESEVNPGIEIEVDFVRVWENEDSMAEFSRECEC